MCLKKLKLLEKFSPFNFLMLLIAGMIITTRPSQICQAVSEEFGTGLTILDAHGYYSNTSKTVLYVVVNRFQIVRLKTIVKGMDPCAYMAISPVADLLHGSKEE